MCVAYGVLQVAFLLKTRRAAKVVEKPIRVASPATNLMARRRMKSGYDKRAGGRTAEGRINSVNPD
jgi:hypothetical protein